MAVFKMTSKNLFHLSENSRIKIFEPLGTALISGVNQNVVYAISGQLMHNYLLPRNCPRVTFYTGHETSETDKKKFFGTSTAEYIVCVESKWLPAIQQTTLYCYEFLPDTFCLYDECAGYYVSPAAVSPVSVKPIYNLIEEMVKRNVELRFMPSIIELGELVKESTLNFSLIRMQHAQPKTDNIIM